MEPYYLFLFLNKRHLFRCGTKKLRYPILTLYRNVQVKSRLSSLIAAVSGKISSGSGKSGGEPTATAAGGGKGRTNNSEETANSSRASKTPPSGQLEKWHSALRIGNKAAATTTPLTDNSDQLISSREGEEIEDEDNNGRLVAGRLLLGTKILVERESGRLFPAVISGHDGDNRVAVTWKEQQQQQLLPQQLTSIVSSSSGPSVSYYEAEELVVKGVLDLAALSSDRLRSGSRVAVFPHPETAYLLPGTVRHVPRTTIECLSGVKMTQKNKKKQLVTRYLLNFIF